MGSKKKAPEKVEGVLADMPVLTEAAPVKSRNTKGILTPADYAEAVNVVVESRKLREERAMPNHYSSVKQLSQAVNKFWEFLAMCATNGNIIIPDIESLAAFLGVSRDQLLSWKRGLGNPEFKPVIEQCYTDIAAVKKQLAFRGDLPQIIYLNDIQNNHGYVNSASKVDVEVSAKRETAPSQQLI
ncbi:MAG: hypothetical protein J6S14_01360, partial [Clostridia bacterium]|nr:hypothetical protein [Clostridia bacterium]